MRLLEKNQVDTLKNDERKKDIEEGVKIAKRIDELRRLEGDERKRITAWRDQTLALAQEDIKKVFSQKDSLQQVVSVLEEERRRLREPLDEEWEKVREKKEELVSRENYLVSREVSYEKKEQSLLQREKEAQVEIGRADDLMRVASQRVADAQKTLSSAQEQSKSMRQRAQDILGEAQFREKIVQEREIQVAIRERDAQNKYDNALRYGQRMFVKEQELKDRWKVLLDTEKTYDRPNTNR